MGTTTAVKNISKKLEPEEMISFHDFGQGHRRSQSIVHIASLTNDTNYITKRT
jgi:hypothetical protein